MILILGLAALIGIVLGLLGGGGSTLMVPMLTYVAGMPAKEAIVTSLIIIGLTSGVSFAIHARAGTICWKNGALFAVGGMTGAYTGGRLAAHLSGQMILIMFALIMLCTAFVMLKPRSKPIEGDAAVIAGCPEKIPVLAILLDAWLIGCMTGLVGAGGGFVIVPALNLLGKLPIKSAIATSLGVISLNAVAALIGYSSHITIDPYTLTPIAVAAVAGSLVGTRLTGWLSEQYLKQGFGVLLLLIAGSLLYKELNLSILEEFVALYSAHSDYFHGAGTVVSLLAFYRLRIWLYHYAPKQHESKNA